MTLIVIIKLFAAIVSVALGAGILARDHGLKANRLIAAFLFCNAFWAATEFFLFQPQDSHSALLLFRVMALGWVPLGVLCMHASLALSAMEDHPIARTMPIFYAGCAVVIPLAVSTDLVIAGVEPAEIGWRPIFAPGFGLAYGLMATPLVMILACWRRTMTLREPRGQLQLARVVFFGLSASLVVGTITAVVLPTLGFGAVGVTTTLVGLVGLAVNRTLRRYGHSLI